MIDILGIGELLIDFTPIDHQEGVSFKLNPGGAPCNMLTMAQKLGSKTAFIGKVGDDQFGNILKNTLEDHDINVEGLVQSKEYNTTLAFVHLDKNGERDFSFYRKGCADVMLCKEDIDYRLVDTAKVIHFGSLSFTDEPSKSTVLDVLRYAKQQGKMISYDPNFRPALWTSDQEAIEAMKLGLEFADVIKVSDEEAELLTGEKEYRLAAKKIFDMGVKLVCVTLGPDGTYYYHKDSEQLVSGFKSKVIDTTGAGDSFFGAVLHGLKGYDLDSVDRDTLISIVSYGNAAASLCIEKLGGIPGIPHKEDVDKRINQS